MDKIVITGGGVAGLSAGIYARLNGFDAEIYEMNAQTGGNLCAWDRAGCRVDNCIHWLTGTNPASSCYGIWRDLGALDEGTEVIQNETLYTCEYGGWSLSLTNDVERLRRDMLEISPADSRETERLIRAIKVMQGISGIAGKGANEKISIFRLAASAPLMLRYFRMTSGKLAGKFRHPLIKRFINGLLTENFGSIALLEVFSCFTGRNGGIPRGGSEAMARRMTERYLSLGGKLYTGKRVCRLKRDGGRITSVVFSDGEEARGSFFIVTCDPAAVFGGITDLPMPQRLAKAYSDRRLRRFSALHCAFLCDEEKPPFRGDLVVGLDLGSRNELHSERIVMREFSHEPDFAPEGKNVIQTMIFTGENEAKRYVELKKRPGEYAEAKKKIARISENAITSRFPGLEGRLKVIDVWTPATYNRYTGSEIGSFMSFAFTSRFLPVPIKSKVNGADNLYLAGQWLQAPGGLPIAARTGRGAVAEIMRAKAGKTAAHTE